MLTLKMIYHVMLTSHWNQCIAFFAQQIIFGMHFVIMLHGCMTALKIFIAIDFRASISVWKTPFLCWILCIFTKNDKIVFIFTVVNHGRLIFGWCFLIKVHKIRLKRWFADFCIQFCFILKIPSLSLVHLLAARAHFEGAHVRVHWFLVVQHNHWSMPTELLHRSLACLLSRLYFRYCTHSIGLLIAVGYFGIENKNQSKSKQLEFLSITFILCMTFHASGWTFIMCCTKIVELVKYRLQNVHIDMARPCFKR